MDIFGMGDRNSDNLKIRYDSIRGNYEGRSKLAVLNRFVELIKEKWTVSINMGQWAINSLLISGRYKNTGMVHD